jgi:hypothetical protein
MGFRFSELDFEQILGFSSPRRTFLDVPERYWMLGRVPTTFSAPLIDFATNKKFGFLRVP